MFNSFTKTRLSLSLSCTLHRQQPTSSSKYHKNTQLSISMSTIYVREPELLGHEFGKNQKKINFLILNSKRQIVKKMPREQTYIMIKPDGVQRGLVGEITRRFESKGFKMVAMKMTSPSKAHLEKRTFLHISYSLYIYHIQSLR